VAAGYDRDVAVSLDGTSFHQIDYSISSPTLVTSAPGGFTVRIPAGQTTATVTLTPIASADVEGPETAIFSAEGSSATVTIVDQFTGLTFTVTNANDAGAGSLRGAIASANSAPGNDLILFAIPGAGVHTINLQSPLPTLTGTVTIDGTSQTGFSGSPLIELNGFNAGPTANGLIIDGNSTTVQALVINRFGTEGQAGSPGGSGIVLRGAGSHRVWMMHIGTNPDGTAALPNRGDGIRIENSANNLIGGESPFANVISGNSEAGIRLIGTDTIGTNIVSNFIGTDRTGTSAIGNTNGVFIDGAATNSVGGTFGVPNIISGNTSAGVVIRGTTAQTNTIGPNFIGTRAGGVLPLGNGGDGVTVSEGALNNLIGNHTFLSQGNVIRFNAQVGVRIESATQNAILNNRISDNGLLGIDLEGDGVTLNDSGDADTGANGRQNFPVLTSATDGVEGTLNSTPNTTFTVAFFGNTACDGSTHGEGATPLGSIFVTTDGTGNATIPFFAAAPGQSVTSTATSPANNTSEFSACVQPEGAVTRTWISDANGFWEDAANWSDGIVPQNGDQVVINRTSANPIVTIQSAVVTLASLQSQEPIVNIGGNLTFDGPAVLSGGLTMSGGQFGGVGDLALGGASVWTGGPIVGTGGMTVQTGGSLFVNTPGGFGVLGRSITNFGTLTWNQAGLAMNGGQILNAGTFEIQDNLFVSNGTIVNTGTLLKSGPVGTLLLTGVQFTSAGTLQLRLGVASDGIVSDAAGSLGGTLDLRLVPGFTPTNGQQFDLLTFGTRIGTFAVVNGNGQTYTPSYTPTGVTLIVGDPGSADVALTMIDSPDPATVNGALIYGLTITNNGPGTAASVTVTDTLPATVTFVSATPSQGTCNGTTPVTCGLGTLPNGASATVLIFVTPTALGQISNTATVTTSSDDPTAANNTATADTTVVNPSLTFVVTNTNDTGAGSFRQALISANSNVSAQDSILFDIPGPGPHVIRPGSALPTISDPVTIFGNSQPGYLDRPVIELDGTNAGQATNGLFITTTNSTVRGLAITRFGTNPPGAGPNDPGGSGIVVFQGVGSNSFQDNFIGLDLSGAAQPNRSDGIFIERSPNNIIGAAGGTGNVISGNGRNGITLNGLETTTTLIIGNFIGTDLTGNADRGNANDGIAIFNAPSNLVGISEGNVISGNGQSGITISGADARFNFISGNIIGADLETTEPIANGTNGITIQAGAHDNSIGPLGSVEPNVIAFNTQAGVRVLSGVNNAIRGNSFYQNGQLGIDLGTAGITANDAGDPDTGANNLQNFPLLDVVTDGVQVTLNTTPSVGAQIDVFSSQGCDASGNGEGATLIGSFVVFTDTFGNATIPFVPVANGQFVTATTTDVANNTSEFSACLEVQAGLTLSLPDGLPIGVGRSVTATVALSEPAPAGGVVVTVTSDAPGIASIAAPGTVSIPGGGTAGQITVNGVSVGTTTLRATAPDYGEGTLGVAVTQNLISTPATLNVAFGQSTALPVNIGPSPAPPGGLTLDVVSINPSIVEVLTPQITVPEGALSANATVRGAGFGNATVTVSNPLYSPSTTTVSSSGGLNIIEAGASFNNGLPGPLLTVRLESNGTPVAALADLVVTLSSADTLCVTAPASVTIPAGLVSTTFRPAYGGTATLACNAVVTATSSGLTPDTVTVTVNQQAGITMPGATAVGASLAVSTGVTLGSAQHGGVTVTIQSDTPSRVLVAPDSTTAGTASITINVPDNQSFVPYYVHGLEAVTGTANVTVSAPNFASGSHAVDVVPSGIEIVSLNTETTTLSTDDTDWYVQVGLPCAGNTHLCTVQNVRSGGPAFVVSLALAPAQTPIAQLRSDQPVATGQTVTKPIQPGIYYTQAIVGVSSYGLTFDPLAGGQTSVTATGPAGVLTMTTTGVRPVTISGPTISVQSAVTVGAGLQLSTFAILGASEHGGVDVTITSSQPSRVLVSRDASTVGTASATVTVPNGQTFVTYYIHGVENVAGSANVTVSAPGFTGGSHAADVVPIGIEILNLEADQTNLSADDTDWYAQVGLPCAGNAQLCAVQNIRPGGPPFIVTFTSTDGNVARLSSDQPTAIGQIVTKPIQPGIYYTQAIVAGTSYGLALDPIGNGTTSVSATGPAGVLTMTTTGTRNVTVSTPAIVPSAATLTVGSGLQLGAFAVLGASQHGGVTMTVTSSAPSVVRVSPDSVTPGATTIGVPIANGTTFVPFVIQGLEGTSGTATVTLSAQGFTSTTIAVTVTASAIEIINLPTSISAESPNVVSWYVQVGLPSGNGSGLIEVQNVRAGSPGFVVTLTNSTAGVAQLGSDEPVVLGQTVTKPIQPGFYYTQAIPFSTQYGLFFDPLAPGTTTVTATGPLNVITTSQAIRTVVISP
jgi:uncharacterized repeat protein (TIGR01451 family)